MTVGGVYEIFDCPNVAGMFAEDIRRFLDPVEYSYGEYWFTSEYRDQVHTGYMHLFKAKGQDHDVTTWPEGSKVASSLVDAPADTPLIVDLAIGGPTYVDGSFTHIGHMEGNGGHSYVQQWLETGEETYQITATLAGSNHLYADGHVQWWHGEDMPRIPGLGFWMPGPQP